MKKTPTILAIALAGILLSAFIGRFGTTDQPVTIPANPQRLGDAQKGRDYLVTGDYVNSGIPYKMFLSAAGKDSSNFLNRTGPNQFISHQFTALEARNGELVVAPNCMQCHAQVFEGKLVMGLGNANIDFTDERRYGGKGLGLVETLLKTTSRSKYEASARFLTATRTIGPSIMAPIKGVNTANRLTWMLMAHRDPQTLKWSDTPLYPFGAEVIPSDTPPWWVLKKKNGMFYTGFGRGDFASFIMLSNLLTVGDTVEAQQVYDRMPDLLAYLHSLEPPAYSRPRNEALAAKGKQLFENHCSDCHGTYGAQETYPNLLIPQSIIQTDSFLFKMQTTAPQFINWYNSSWYSQGGRRARLEPFEGYIAPPLDGVWITAPYLHNGSVPTLEALLNSKARPRYWSRNFENPEYDYQKVGWKFREEKAPGSPETYNTDLPGYGNYGHYFGDLLTGDERTAVIEYLKGI
ncbi:c-type cytochrome [Paraflavisolibacter sp. H34]|uniref:c-type cytochrome n=1 Tax=Huijunlia imazamoxiresistens TaxID=3127457 RepID=UPI0030162D74